MSGTAREARSLRCASEEARDGSSDLRDRLTEINESSSAILAKANAASRDLSAELDDLIAEFKATESNIGRMQAIGEMGAIPTGRRR